MRKVIVSILICASSNLLAQVAKNVVVEHFTNTVCSVCAGKNPGFYSNLDNHADIIHITFHPSSPYASCLLNKHNTAENDGRTYFYSIYGATPRFVIQGEVISTGTNVSQPSLFTPYIGKTSPASIKLQHEKFNSDSVHCRIVIKTEVTNTLGSLKLFVALAEDSISYSSPNGESLHHDVFRKALSDIQGDLVNLPANAGDSLVLFFSSTGNIDWNMKRIFAIAILQEDGNKAVVQSAATNSDPAGSPVGISEKKSSDTFKIFPNPANDFLSVTSENRIDLIRILDVSGQVVLENAGIGLNSIDIDISLLPKGIYLLELLHEGQSMCRRFIKS